MTMFCRADVMLPWVMMTALGAPVLPPV